jgi:hypothetical protein
LRSSPHRVHGGDVGLEKIARIVADAILFESDFAAQITNFELRRLKIALAQLIPKEK